MIGPVNSYQDIYVAACGEDFASHAVGIDHERNCPMCRAETGYEPPEECDADDRGICYEKD